MGLLDTIRRLVSGQDQQQEQQGPDSSTPEQETVGNAGVQQGMAGNGGGDDEEGILETLGSMWDTASGTVGSWAEEIRDEASERLGDIRDAVVEQLQDDGAVDGPEEVIEEIEAVAGPAPEQAEDAAPEGATTEGDSVEEGGDGSFATAFNAEFAPVLRVFRGRDAGEDWSGPDNAQLQRLFTAGQRAKLAAFCGNHQIPNRLFNGDDTGGEARPRQRVVVSSHILATGTLPEGASGRQEDTGRPLARCCRHWVQLVNTYAGIADPRAEGVEENFDLRGNIVLGAGDAPETEGGSNSRTSIIDPGRFEEVVHAGDWLQIAHPGGGGHSIIFFDWEGPLRTWRDTEGQTLRWRRCIAFDQNNTSEGGRMTEGNRQNWALGERAAQLQGGPGVRAIFAHTPVSDSAHTVGSAEEFHQTLEAGAVERQGGDQEEALEARREENRGALEEHGIADTAPLEEWIQRENDRIIEDHLQGRLTPGQRSILDEANTTDRSLEELVRLNERLSELRQGAQALDRTAGSWQADRAVHGGVSQDDLIGDPLRDQGTTGLLSRVRGADGSALDLESFEP